MVENIMKHYNLTKISPDEFLTARRGLYYCELSGRKFYNLYDKMCKLERIKVHVDRSLYIIVELNKKNDLFYCENGREVKLGMNIFPSYDEEISGDIRDVAQADTGVCIQSLYRVAPMQDIGMCIRSAEKGYICNLTIPDDAFVFMTNRYIFTDKIDVTFIQKLEHKFVDWEWDVVSIPKKGGAILEQRPPESLKSYKKK